MASTATAPAVGPRFAPDDPTLPSPWKGLVDGKTGYLYYWNPETNVTQYEKPTASVTESKSPSRAIGSSINVQQSSRHGQIAVKDDGGYDRGNTSGFKSDSGSSGGQNARSGADQYQSVRNGMHSGPNGFSIRNGSSARGSNLTAEAYRSRHEVTVMGDDVPAPLTSFEDSGFASEILREVYNAGFSAPTPIQAQSWPIALQGRDIVAIAKTGSGKTLGYLIPGFIHVKHRRNNPQLGPTVLVLAPTRELATQIQDEAVKFGRSSGISCTCLYGGAQKGPQLNALDRGVDVVVATPGRLNDILEMRRISLGQVSYLVLDEADRMLDMGFEPQIRKIVKEVPSHRQTLMYTATWPKEVRKIAADLLVNPVQVNIGNVDELVANKSITQYIEVLPPMEKHRRLEQILRSQDPGSKILIFCSTKKMCDQLARNLSRQFRAAAIHGDKSQGERDYVLNQFRAGRSPVLVATDVAARGLDIKDIRVVINYDFPTGVEDYVHRIGRTGRAGATGVAYTFFGDQDAKFASDLIKVLEGADQRVPPEVREMALRGGGMNKFRRWGPGPGGHDAGRGGHGEFGRGGRYGGRVSSSSQSMLEKGRGPVYDHEPRERYAHGYNNSHEKRRSRSRSAERWSGMGDPNKHRSPERYDKAALKRGRSPELSFHQQMMDRSNAYQPTQNHRDRSHSLFGRDGGYRKERKDRGWSSSYKNTGDGEERAPRGGRGDRESKTVARASVVEEDDEHEEGMISG